MHSLPFSDSIAHEALFQSKWKVALYGNDLLNVFLAVNNLLPDLRIRQEVCGSYDSSFGVELSLSHGYDGTTTDGKRSPFCKYDGRGTTLCNPLPPGLSKVWHRPRQSGRHGKGLSKKTRRIFVERTSSRITQDPDSNESGPFYV